MNALKKNLEKPQHTNARKHLSIGKLVVLFESRGLSGGLHLLIEVEGDIGELFLDVDNFLLIIQILMKIEFKP